MTNAYQRLYDSVSIPADDLSAGLYSLFFKEVKYMRILIVEDEKDLSMILTEMLEMEGYYVDAAYDGVSGLDNALSGIYDIINSGYYAA